MGNERLVTIQQTIQFSICKTSDFGWLPESWAVLVRWYPHCAHNNVRQAWSFHLASTKLYQQCWSALSHDVVWVGQLTSCDRIKELYRRGGWCLRRSWFTDGSLTWMWMVSHTPCSNLLKPSLFELMFIAVQVMAQGGDYLWCSLRWCLLQPK